MFVGFLLLGKDAFSCYLAFPLLILSLRELGLVGMHLAAAYKWVVTKFSYSSFGACLSDVS